MLKAFVCIGIFFIKGIRQVHARDVLGPILIIYLAYFRHMSCKVVLYGLLFTVVILTLGIYLLLRK